MRVLKSFHPTGAERVGLVGSGVDRREGRGWFKQWIGDRAGTHRVDIAFDEVVLLRLQHQVVSSEGDDTRLGAAARDLGEPV